MDTVQSIQISGQAGASTDKVLAEHYGFTAEELETIIKTDTCLRMASAGKSNIAWARVCGG